MRKMRNGERNIHFVSMDTYPLTSASLMTHQQRRILTSLAMLEISICYGCSNSCKKNVIIDSVEETLPYHFTKVTIFDGVTTIEMLILKMYIFRMYIRVQPFWLNTINNKFHNLAISVCV